MELGLFVKDMMNDAEYGGDKSFLAYVTTNSLIDSCFSDLDVMSRIGQSQLGEQVTIIL